MSIHDDCPQGKTIGRIAEQVDKIHDVLTTVAAQKERLDIIGKTVGDHERRIRYIENAPTRALYWFGGIVATVIAAWVVHAMFGA